LVHAAISQNAGTRPVSARSPVRKDIQGLRAIAVVLVVLNHLWPRWVSGGYIGVDIFFVISGYLITKHLLGELTATGRNQLGRFYSRRAKRLLPAAFLVALVSMVVAWLVLPFSRWVTISQEVIASVLYVENWFLASKSVDYSAHNESASTVQHYWSLSVEEQFYIVWPLLLLSLYLIYRRQRSRSSRESSGPSQVSSGTVLLAITVLGFIASVIITIHSPNEAYFITPTRVWEFATGGLIAWWATRREALLKPSTVHTLLLWAAYLAIALSALLLTGSSVFPGYIASVPVLATALIIWVGPDSRKWTPNLVLSTKPFQYVGDISYSIYLWHWPLIILWPSITGSQLNFWHKIAIVALSLVLAGLTKRFIEDPGRQRLFRTWSPRRVLLGTVAAMASCVLLGSSLSLAAAVAQAHEANRLEALASGPCFGAGSMMHPDQCPDPFGAAMAANIGDAEAPWFDDAHCSPSARPLSADGGAPLVCDFGGDQATSKDVWLIGDSHAEQWKIVVHKLAAEHNWRLTESLRGGCPIVDVKRVAFMGESTPDRANQERCLSWSEAVKNRILDERPDAVIVSSFAAGETIDDGTGRSQTDQYRDAVDRQFGPLREVGIDTYFIRDTPLTLDTSTPDCLALNETVPLNCSTNRRDALPPDPMATGALTFESSHFHVIDLSDLFCDENRCYAVIGGLHVYFDRDHAARSFIESTYPVFVDRLAKANAAGRLL